MQRMFPTRSRERITSWDNLNRYFAALSPSSAPGQGSACGLSPPKNGSAVVDWIGSAPVTSDFITSWLIAYENPCPMWIVRGCACQKSNNPVQSRHFCFLPRRRCYPLSLAKHQKILPLPRGRAARAYLAFGTNKIIQNENQTESKHAATQIASVVSKTRSQARPDAPA